MSNNQSQNASTQTEGNRTGVVVVERKQGVPSRQEMYSILKERSIQLQGGSEAK